MADLEAIISPVQMSATLSPQAMQAVISPYSGGGSGGNAALVPQAIAGATGNILATTTYARITYTAGATVTLPQIATLSASYPGLYIKDCGLNAFAAPHTINAFAGDQILDNVANATSLSIDANGGDVFLSPQNGVWERL